MAAKMTREQFERAFPPLVLDVRRHPRSPSSPAVWMTSNVSAYVERFGKHSCCWLRAQSHPPASERLARESHADVEVSFEETFGLVPWWCAS